MNFSAYPPLPPPRTGPSYVGPIVAWSATGAFAIVWGAMGGLALSASSDLTSLKQKVTTTAALNAQGSKTKVFAGVSDGFMVGTIVGAGVATALTIVVATSSKSSARIGVSVSPASVTLDGAF